MSIHSWCKMIPDTQGEWVLLWIVKIAVSDRFRLIFLLLSRPIHRDGDHPGCCFSYQKKNTSVSHTIILLFCLSLQSRGGSVRKTLKKQYKMHLWEMDFDGCSGAPGGAWGARGSFLLRFSKFSHCFLIPTVRLEGKGMKIWAPLGAQGPQNIAKPYGKHENRWNSGPPWGTRESQNDEKPFEKLEFSWNSGPPWEALFWFLWKSEFS